MKHSIKDKDKYDPETIKRIRNDFDKALGDPKNIQLILSEKFNDPALEKENIKTLEIFENIRNNLQKIKDNELRYREFLKHNFRATIIPRLVNSLIKYKLPKEYIYKIIPQDDIIKILHKLPTALCEFILLFRRDQLLQRPIQANDIPDLWHLQLAIPYSDIVVIDKMWASISIQSKLDQICDTILLQSVNGLSSYL